MLARRQLARKMSVAAAASDIQGFPGGAPNSVVPPAAAAVAAAAAGYANPASYMMWNPYSGHQGVSSPLLPTAALGRGPLPPQNLFQQPHVYGQQLGQQLRFGLDASSKTSPSPPPIDIPADVAAKQLSHRTVEEVSFYTR